MQNIKYVIEDEIHAELHGEYDSFEKALVELKRRKDTPYGVAPNICSCTSWKTCERRYEITQYDTSVTPWKVVERTPVLGVSAKEVKWLIE